MASTQNVQVSFLGRDFNSLRASLIDFARTYHSDKFAFFNDASPDMLYLELTAYVGDVLNFYIDRTFNESFLTTAQARESLIRISNDLGFFETGPSPSSTQVIFSIRIPYVVDSLTGVIKPDPDLLISIDEEMRLQSDNGTTFEVLEAVSFADSRNRKIIPNLDSNKQIIDYTIEKTAVAKAGITKIQRFYVSPDLAKPFLAVTLDDTGITEITGVTTVTGNVFVAPPDSDFKDTTKAFFQVRTLVEDQIFAEINPVQPQTPNDFIDSTLKQGAFVAIPKRFITRRDVNDLVTLTFGSNTPSFSAFNTLLQSVIQPDALSLNQVLNNTALGEIPPPNSTLFIKYRTGGGAATDAIAGQINSIVVKTFAAAPVSNAPNFLQKLQQARNSLVVRNEIPAVGGSDIPTNEEVRASTGKVFAAQDRAVTYEDVVNLLKTIPAQFGRPYRISYEEIRPRVANLSNIDAALKVFLEDSANGLLAQTTTVGRQKVVSQINDYLEALRTGTSFIPVGFSNSAQDKLKPVSAEAVSANILNAIGGATLWIGEKARLYILGIDEEGHLTTAFKNSDGIFVSSNQLLKENLREFLRDKRVIGDWIDIVDGRVINIQVEFTIMVDKRNKQQVLVEALNKMKSFFAIANWQMNQPIFIANASTALQEISGVINVVSLKFYNVFDQDIESGKIYSPQEVGRYRFNSSVAANTQMNKFEMLSSNNIIQQFSDSIFEVKYSDVDIRGNAI